MITSGKVLAFLSAALVVSGVSAKTSTGINTATTAVQDREIIANLQRQWYAADYEQNGLLVQWDGIENAGPQKHDSESAVWKNLAPSDTEGTYDLGLNESTKWYGTWGDSWMDVKGLSATGAVATASYTTIEVFYMCSAVQSGKWLFSSGIKNRCCIFSSDGYALFNGSASDLAVPYVVGAAQTVSAIYSGTGVSSVYANGVRYTAGTKKSNTKDVSPVALIGDRLVSAAAAWQGRVYAIRLYSTALTEEQLYRHNLLDRARFLNDPDAIAELSKKGYAVDEVPLQVFSGAASEPEVIVRDEESGEKLKPGVDYTVDYDNNTKPGLGTATIMLLRDDYYPTTCVVDFPIGLVLRVKNETQGSGTGATWGDAMNLSNACLFASTSGLPCEVWLAGTIRAGQMSTTPNFPMAVNFRGGFAGSEESAGERVRGALSLIEGQDVGSILPFANDKTVMIESVEFAQGKYRGIAKSGPGNILVTNCVFLSNGGANEPINGRAMFLSGDVSSTRAEVIDCRILDQRVTYTGTQSSGTGAICLQSLAGATVSDCLFASNGVEYAVKAYQKSGSCPARFGAGGVAISTFVPTVISRSQFRVNYAPSACINMEEVSAGVVRLNPGSSGTVIENCLFTGNENGNVRNDYEDVCGGTISVMLKSQADKITIRNCTFAYNLFDGHTGTAGINVWTGTVDVRNSIFYGNLANNSLKTFNPGANPADILVHEGATLNAYYTMFGQAGEQVAKEGGTLLLDASCKFDNPFLMTQIDNLSSYRSGYMFAPACMAELMQINAHLCGRSGYTDETTGALVKSKRFSPAIDAGDPESDYKQEPEPNGGCVNLGFYGNTAWATRSKSGFVLLIR